MCFFLSPGRLAHVRKANNEPVAGHKDAATRLLAGGGACSVPADPIHRIGQRENHAATIELNTV